MRAPAQQRPCPTAGCHCSPATPETGERIITATPPCGHQYTYSQQAALLGGGAMTVVNVVNKAGVISRSSAGARWVENKDTHVGSKADLHLQAVFRQPQVVGQPRQVPVHAEIEKSPRSSLSRRCAAHCGKGVWRQPTCCKLPAWPLSCSTSKPFATAGPQQTWLAMTEGSCERMGNE